MFIENRIDGYKHGNKYRAIAYFIEIKEQFIAVY